MNSSYICAGCRRKLSQIRAEKTVQWRSRATFISLARSIATPTRLKDEPAKGDLSDIADDPRSTKGQKSVKLPEVKRQLPRPPGHANPGDMLEMLFEETIKEPSATADVPSQILSSLEPYKNAETLKRMVEDSNCSITEAWQFFVETFGAKPESSSSLERKLYPSYLAERSRTLMKRLIHAKNKDNPSAALPSVTEISRIYTQQGLLHGGEWVQLMSNLLVQISKSGERGISESGSRAELISDFIASWNVVSRMRVSSDEHPVEYSPALDWSQLPIVSKKLVFQVFKKNGINGCFSLLTPSFPPRLLKDLPLLAFGSFSMLTKPPTIDGVVSQNAAPLISTLGRMISLCGMGYDELCSATTDEAANFIAKLVGDDWRRLNECAAGFDAERGVSTRSSSSLSSTSHAFVHRRVRDAYMQRDARQVDKLWSDVADFPVHKDVQTFSRTEGGLQAQSHLKGKLTAGLCNYFILVYMGLRQPDRAIDVWNHMVNKGLSPDLITWNHMLMGCKASRDWKALQDVWSRMLQMGIVPDVHCWTTFVSGLMDSGRVDQAIRALEHMGRIWMAEAKRKAEGADAEDLGKIGDINKVVKPTIEIFNAALAGLLRKRRPDTAYRMLNWASTLGINPDATTYNTLLRPLIRDGHTTEAMDVLKQMQKAGIPADVVTFTTILDETFRDSAQHSPEEQKTIINDLFTEMEAAGVQANLHTYGKVIYQLLQSSSQDLTAVNTVLERMASQGLQPSTYIYTILIEHYFAQQPPDLDAVQSLIDRAALQPGGADHIFWDRVIEGYARVGDTGSAMRILGKVYKAKSKASWITLRTLLTALVENDEIEVARSLVRTTRSDNGGPIDQEVKGTEGQHRFWSLVRDLELLDS